MIPFLRKAISRVTKSEVREAGRMRKVIVTLRPPNIIGFRTKGCRTEYQITADGGYWAAMRAHTIAESKEKKRVKRKRK
jgi:hypothetical protein